MAWIVDNLEWMIPSGIALAGLVLAAILQRTDKKERRIKEFVETFFSKYKGAGVVMELLMPSGINNLKDDGEIEEGLQILNARLGFQPLRDSDQRIRDIGYKEFFTFALQQKFPIRSETIKAVVDAYQTMSKIDKSLWPK